MAERIKQAQADINRRRSLAGKPPADEFETFKYENGFVTMPAEDFKRLSKAKKNKLLKGAGAKRCRSEEEVEKPVKRLTYERRSGMGVGYWSPAKKDELVQRLGAYEATGLEPEEIKAGKKRDWWIPVTERLPEEPEPGMLDMDSLEEYIVTISGATKPTVLLYAGNGEWYRDEIFYSVDAWMPLPEAFDNEN